MKPIAQNDTNGWYKICAILTGLGLVALNIVRILNVPVTFDEALSYDTTPLSYADIILYNKGVTANNHMLNTVLVKFLTSAFSGHQFWVRLDSLLAQLMYLLCTYLICNQLLKKWEWKLCLFLALNVQPFLFEFWGLSRGYGLSLAFMAASIYYLLRYLQAHKASFLIPTLGFAVLATCSNFTLLNYYCGLVCVVIVKNFLPGKPVSTKTQIGAQAVIIATTTILLAILITGPLQKLAKAKQLYFGGAGNNIVDDTINSLLNDNLHLNDPKYNILVYCLATLTILATVIISFYYLARLVRKQNTSDDLAGIVLWLLFIVPASSVIAQHVLFHTPYPIERTALYFIPLYLLMCVYFLYTATGIGSVYRQAILYVLTGCFLCNFLAHLDTYKTTTWWLDEHNTVVLNKIAEENKGASSRKTICVDWVFLPAVHYYIETKYVQYIDHVVNIAERKPGDDSAFDYYYVSRDEMKTLPKIYFVDTAFYDGWYLLMRKNSIK